MSGSSELRLGKEAESLLSEVEDEEEEEEEDDDRFESMSEDPGLEMDVLLARFKDFLP